MIFTCEIYKDDRNKENMEREELVAFLYKARSFFERAEDLRNQHNHLLQTYQLESPHENPREHIEYRPYIKIPGNKKEWKKWKGISGFLKSFGIWFFLVIYFLFKYAVCYSINIERTIEWVSTLLYQNGVTEIGKVYRVMDDGTVSSFRIGDPDQYYWWDFLDLYIIFIISALVTILIIILINAMISSRNNQIKKRNCDIIAKNQAIQRENQAREQENRNIDRYNANLVQKNKEIDEHNIQVAEYNRAIDRKLDEVNGQMLALWEEMNDFIGKDQFPQEDFNLEAIDFYINEVRNHRCDSIKECANAYVAAQNSQQMREYQNEMLRRQDEQIQIGREQVQIGKEQIQWQRISAFLQVEQILQSIANARTVANAVDRNTAATCNTARAVDRAAAASNRAADAAENANRNFEKAMHW